MFHKTNNDNNHSNNYNNNNYSNEIYSNHINSESEKAENTNTHLENNEINIENNNSKEKKLSKLNKSIHSFTSLITSLTTPLINSLFCGCCKKNNGDPKKTELKEKIKEKKYNVFDEPIEDDDATQKNATLAAKISSFFLSRYDLLKKAVTSGAYGFNSEDSGVLPVINSLFKNCMGYIPIVCTVLIAPQRLTVDCKNLMDRYDIARREEKDRLQNKAFFTTVRAGSEFGWGLINLPIDVIAIIYQSINYMSVHGVSRKAVILKSKQKLTVEKE